MADQKNLTITAPAKINLYLAILGKRVDGYHELESLMVKLDLCDQLHLTRQKEGIRLSCPGSGLPEDDDNLVFRAAGAFFDHTKISGGVAMVLEKRIPVAAGLGGGSSDAAAVLKGLDALFGTNLDTQTLLALAKPLGADVPFFVLDASAAWARGIGEQLQPVALTGLGSVVLVNPGFDVSTKWVYDNLDLSARGNDARQQESAQSANLALTTGGNPYILGRGLASADSDDLPCSASDVALVNDLETVTLGRYPEVGEIKNALITGGARGALMSGSGPTVFGLFDKEEDALRCCDTLRQRYGDLVFLTRQFGA